MAPRSHRNFSPNELKVTLYQRFPRGGLGHESRCGSGSFDAPGAGRSSDERSWESSWPRHHHHAQGDFAILAVVDAKRAEVSLAGDALDPKVNSDTSRMSSFTASRSRPVDSAPWCCCLATAGCDSEAAALRVGDVNLKTRRIRVRRSVTNVTGKGLVEGATKNHGARTVPVPKFLAPLLETEIGERPETELLFPSRRGGYLTVGEVRWVFDPAVKAVGLGGLTPHELRHTCASLAIAAGANVKVLQTLLGHKTATLTLDRYGHLFPDDLGKIADGFDEAAEITADALRTVTRLKAVPANDNML